MKFLTLALQYLPFVLNGVKSVETAMSGASGASKRAVILAAVSAAAQAGEQVPESHVQVISALIDSTVGALNASGVFGTSKPSQ